MPGNEGTRREGHKIIIAASIASRRERNGTSTAGAKSVGGIIVFEDLHVAAEFEAQFVKIGRRGTRNDCIRAHGVGYAV